MNYHVSYDVRDPKSGKVESNGFDVDYGDYTPWHQVMKNVIDRVKEIVGPGKFVFRIEAKAST